MSYDEKYSKYQTTDACLQGFSYPLLGRIGASFFLVAAALTSFLSGYS